MPPKTKNLGLVRAIHVGTTAPTNTYMLWYNLGDDKVYFYNVGTTAWVAIDSSLAHLPLSGGQMTGEIDMQGSALRSTTGTLNLRTANGYVDIQNAADRLRLDTTLINGLGPSSPIVVAFQNTSGTIALLSDITAISTLAAILAGGNTTSDGQTIEAENGGGALNLRSGGDGRVSLTNDNDAQLKEGVYMSSDYIALFSDGYSTALELYQMPSAGNYGIDMYTLHAMIAIFDNTDVSPTQNGLLIFDTASGAVTSPAVGTHKLVAILCSPSSGANANVTNSVALGGTALVLKTNNTAYVNQLGLNDGGTYEVILNHDGVSMTADVIQTLQAKDGTIANLDDIKNITVGSDVSSSTHTGDTNETVLKTIEIPAGTFQQHDWMEFWWMATKSDLNGAAQITVYLNTSAGISGSPEQIARYSANNVNYSLKREFAIDSSTSMLSYLQSSGNTGTIRGGSNSAQGTYGGVIDFTSTMYLVFTVTLTHISDTVDLNAVKLERKRP